MKKTLRNDKNLRNKFYKDEMIKFVLKSIIKNKNFYDTIKWNLIIKLSKFYNSSITKIKNRCFLTGRKFSVIKTLKISRLTFLKLSRSGSIMGLQKQ